MHSVGSSAGAAALVRIIVVDDHPVVREGLKAMVSRSGRFKVVGEAEGGAEAIRIFAELRPDIVLLDLRLPDMAGAEVIRGLRAVDDGVRVVVITSFDGDEDIFRAIEAGAQGYLLKGTFPEAIESAIEAVLNGRRFLPASLAARLGARADGEALTARELEVLSLLGAGLANKEISARLFLSDDTVKTHLKNLFRKLRVSDRTQAVLVGLRRGLLVPPSGP